MNKQEIQYEFNMNYLELCDYLKAKYGTINEPFFVNANCKTPNRNIKRSNEGLFIHHIKENEGADLTKTENAKYYGYEFQQGNNLVYCNLLEHLILHYKITNEYFSCESAKKTKSLLGIGGLIQIIYDLNDLFDGYDYSRIQYIKSKEILSDNYFDYLNLLCECYILNENKVINEMFEIMNNVEVNDIIGKINFATIKFSQYPYRGRTREGNNIKKDFLELLKQKNISFN